LGSFCSAKFFDASTISLTTQQHNIDISTKYTHEYIQEKKKKERKRKNSNLIVFNIRELIT